MSTETIKEFLVSLGFKTDEAQQKKFANGIAFATARVNLLVDAVEKASVKVYEGVSHFVNGMESLYYSSKRTGASVEGIKAFEFAAEHLGATAQEARGSIEGLANFMRSTPGSEGFIKALGVQTRDANGKLRDTTETMIDLGKKFKEMPWYHAQQYTGLLGIDDNTLRALRSGEFESGYNKFKEKFAKNVNFEKAAEDAREFRNKARELGAQFDVLGVQIEAALLTKLGPQLDQFMAWLQVNGPKIANAVTRAMEMLLNVADKLAPIFMWVLDMLGKADTLTNGWSSSILALAAVMKILGFSVFGAAGSIAGLVLNMGKLTMMMSGVIAKAAALSAAAMAGWEVGSAIYKEIEGTDTADAIGAGITKVLAVFGNKDAQETQARVDAANAARPTVLGNAPVSAGGVNSHVNQKTDIHVYGGDSANIGKQVAGEQDRVNSNMVRNMKGAYR